MKTLSESFTETVAYILLKKRPEMFYCNNDRIYFLVPICHIGIKLALPTSPFLIQSLNIRRSTNFM